jgi:hypothetical protein
MLISSIKQGLSFGGGCLSGIDHSGQATGNIRKSPAEAGPLFRRRGRLASHNTTMLRLIGGGGL